MSTTPRTDAVLLSDPGSLPNHARQLETQLTARDATIEGLLISIADFGEQLEQARSNRETAQREAEGLLEAIEDFVHNVEHQYVTDGARVREDGAYHRLKKAAQLPPLPSAAPVHPDTARLD